MSNDVIFLLIAFQLKHFLCDYIFQTEYHLGKFKVKGWVAPLASHCHIHALGTMIICVSFSWLYKEMPVMFALCLVAMDFALHFIQDRIKASPNLLGRWKPDNKYFWWALGQDQLVHHLTHYLIIWLLVSI